MALSLAVAVVTAASTSASLFLLLLLLLVLLIQKLPLSRLLHHYQADEKPLVPAKNSTHFLLCEHHQLASLLLLLRFPTLKHLSSAAAAAAETEIEIET